MSKRGIPAGTPDFDSSKLKGASDRVGILGAKSEHSAGFNAIMDAIFALGDKIASFFRFFGRTGR